MRYLLAAALALVSEITFADLPVARAPLARQGLVRKPAVLTVTPLFDREGKPYERVTFEAGTRSLVLHGDIGTWPWNHLAHFGILTLLEGSRPVAEMTLFAMNEWDAKTITPGEKIVVDKAKGTVTWSRPYTLKDGSVRTFSYTAQALSDGRVAVDYDFGLSCEEAQKAGRLPISCRLNLEAAEDGTVEYGFGDKVHEPYSAAVMLAENRKQVNWGYGQITSPVFNYETRDPLKHWSVTFPRASLMKAYGWVEYPGTLKNGKRWRGAMIHAGQAIGDFTRKDLANDVKGRFIWDLGATSLPAVTPEPPVGGIDFWGLDALHVPVPSTRNLLMNGSFEQDLKGWRWEDWGSVYTPSDVLREEVVPGGRFGAHALCLRSVQMGCPALCSAPLALEKDKTYTVSCWARCVEGTKGDFAFRVRSVSNKGKYWQFRGIKEFRNCACRGTDWQRFSFSFKADMGGFFVQIAPGYGAGKTGVLVDGIQVEEGPVATDYTEPACVANLVTADPYNDLKPGDSQQLRLVASSLSGFHGEMRVRIDNAYHETVCEKTFPLDVPANGAQDVMLALDKTLPVGLYVVRTDFTAAKTTWTDYTRFSIQEPLDGTHATANIYANHEWFARVSRAPHYAKKFVEWGWKSVDGRRNIGSVGSPAAELAQAHGIRNYVHPVAYEGDEVRAAVTNRPSGSRAPFKGCAALTGKPEELELFEVAAYESAKKADPKDDIWTFWNEEESWARQQGYETHWQFVAAVQRGVRRAFAERGLPPPRFSETHGTSHYFNGRNYDAIEGYLKTALAHGYRYDVVTVHPYSNIDGGVLGPHDADVETQHLIDTMAKYGYPATTPIMFTESFNMQPWRFPSWGCDGWGDSYRSNTTPSHDLGNREFLMAASQMRLYILALKFWPKLQLVHPWNREPVVDLRFTPLLFTFSANTLGHLLPSPKYLGDAQPYADVRGYCFQQGDKAVMPVWTTDHEVENGVKKSPVLEMTLPGDVEFRDMFGNVRKPASSRVRTEGGFLGFGGRRVVRVPLTPAPLFLVSKDAQALLKAVREAVADDPSTALRADVRPDISGHLNLSLENLTKAPRRGDVHVGGKTISYDLAPRASAAYPLVAASAEPMRWQTWKGVLSPIFTKPWQTAWFVVPHCGETPDWSKIPALPLSTVQGVSAGTTATCQYAWNKDYLFVRVAVKDACYLPRAEMAQPFRPHDLYAYDGCLEVYFDGFADARSQGEKDYDGNDSRYDLLENDVFRFKAVNWQLAQGTRSATDEEIEAKLKRRWTRTADGYVYELAFAQRYLAPIDLKPGTVAGAALCLHAYNRDAQGKTTHASISNATLPGYDCNRKPWVWPLVILGE